MTKCTEMTYARFKALQCDDVPCPKAYMMDAMQCSNRNEKTQQTKTRY